MAPHYGVSMVFMLHISTLKVLCLRVQPLLTSIVYFLSDLYSHPINMKHFLPATDVTFSSYSPYLSHIYTDQPNQLTNLLTTIYHWVTFQLLRCRQKLFLLAAVSSASLSPSASSDILSPTVLLKVSNLDRERWRTAALLIGIYGPCGTLCTHLRDPRLFWFFFCFGFFFLDSKMYVSAAEISRQPQRTHRNCDVGWAAKYRTPVPIIRAVAL